MSYERSKEIFWKLVRIYREKGFRNPQAMLNYRINELMSVGKTREEATATLYERETGERLQSKGVRTPEVKSVNQRVKELEEEVYKLRQRQKRIPRAYIGKPSGFWYLVPFFLSIIGGLIGYVAVKDEDEGMALNLLLFGFFMFFVDLVVAWLYYRWLLSLF